MKNKRQLDIALCITILWIVLFILKINGLGIVATWNWWWVSSPIWIPIVLLVFLFLYTMTVEVFKYYLRKRRFEKKFNVK